MVTPLQEAIFEELEKYTSIEIMRENAQAIADKVAQKAEIGTCSKTYVLRMIKRREDSSETVSFKVEPPESEVAEESEESDISTDAKDAEDWEFEEPEEEPEPDEGEEQRGGSIDEIITLKATRTLVVVPFRIAADWTGYDGFLLTEEETKELVPVIRPLLLKYVPQLFVEYLPEILCAFVISFVLIPKIKGYRQFQEDQRKAAIAQEKAEKSANEAHEREQRRSDIEEQERLRRQNEPQPEEPKKPKTKNEAGIPSWNDPKRAIG